VLVASSSAIALCGIRPLPLTLVRRPEAVTTSSLLVSVPIQTVSASTEAGAGASPPLVTDLRASRCHRAPTTTPSRVTRSHDAARSSEGAWTTEDHVAPRSWDIAVPASDLPSASPTGPATVTLQPEIATSSTPIEAGGCTSENDRPPSNVSSSPAVVSTHPAPSGEIPKLPAKPPRMAGLTAGVAVTARSLSGRIAGRPPVSLLVPPSAGTTVKPTNTASAHDATAARGPRRDPRSTRREGLIDDHTHRVCHQR